MKVKILTLFLVMGFGLFTNCNNTESDLIEEIEAIDVEEEEDEEEEIDDNPAEYSLLFIGNSLTDTNNLPNLVKAYAADQETYISVTSITYGGYALIDHWNDGGIQTSITTQNYDFVIVQQGPSSQPYGRSLLIEYGGLISQLCRQYDTKLAYYMVWPSLGYYDTFDGVIESYRLAANANDDILCPVGEVWKAYFDETGDFSYYGGDGFHPSLAGSEVAAKVIYESLFVGRGD